MNCVAANCDAQEINNFKSKEAVNTVNLRLKKKSLKLKTLSGKTEQLKRVNLPRVVDDEMSKHEMGMPIVKSESPLPHSASELSCDVTFRKPTPEVFDDEYRTTDQLYRRYSAHHSEVNTNTKMNIYRCSVCSRYFVVRARLLVHCVNAHGFDGRKALKSVALRLLARAKSLGFGNKTKTRTTTANKPKTSQIARAMRKHSARILSEHGSSELSTERVKLEMRKHKSSVPECVEVVESTFNKCGWCGVSFKKRSDLVVHRMTVHRRAKSEV